MSDKDQTQPTPGHEQTRDPAKSQGERSSSSSGADSSSGGSRGRGGRHGGRRRHGGGQQQSSSQPQHSPSRAEASLNMEELRELMELFTSHGLTDFEFENEDIRVRLSKNLTTEAVAPAAASARPPATSSSPGAAPSNTTSAAHSSAPSDSATRAEDKTEDLHIITSPIVGTFYRSPSPTADPFVKQGSHVEPDTIVCIIEAMKLMNEILSETTGVVEKIYVENGQPVEYGQPLFGIKK